MPNKKKVDPAISEHFREMQKKAWAKRKKRILESKKVDQINTQQK